MQKSSDSSECQVVVVGAGPTGLVMAAALLARGINTRIIDKGDGVVLETRALAVHARTLEMLDSMSLAERFVERGHKVRHTRMYSSGKPLVDINFTLNGSRFDCMLDIPQHETEQILRQRVVELGGRIEGSTELVSLRQSSERVTCTIRRGDGTLEEVVAEYVAGCDGAHSRVRHAVGLTFDGHAYQEDWLLADVLMDWSRPEDSVHAFFRPDGLPMIAFPLREHVWRLVFPYTGNRNRQAPTLEEIQQLVDQRAPEPVRVSNPMWLANFRCSLRSANAYRSGRVLLAGDAAHVHSPAGGQGMNTGMQDAHNLAWKLALVVQGHSPESLLDTYAEERAPIGADVLALTHAIVQLGTVRSPWKRVLRDIFVPVGSRIPFVQRRAVRRMSQVHIAYESSSLTQRASESEALRPGEHAPDVVVVCGSRRVRLYEALRSGRHMLVATRSRHDIAEFGATCDVVHRDGPVWLVRPDGYIAAVGIDSARAYLERVFGSTTTKPSGVQERGVPSAASIRPRFARTGFTHPRRSKYLART